MVDEIQRWNDDDPKVRKSTEPTSFTFNTKRVLKKSKGLEHEKPYARKHGGRSRQEEMCTHPTTDEGQTDARGNMADKLFDGHRDIAYED